MKPLRKFHPDLRACGLDDRLLPATANLGAIVLTTGGYVLMSPFPGSAADPGGTVIPTSFFMTGSGGVSSIQPDNSTGVPSFAPTPAAGSTGSTGATIAVSSEANDPTTASISLVTRNTIANDALNSAPRIGGPSWDRSPMLPAGQFYRGGVPVTAPVPAPAPLASATSGEPSSRSLSQNAVHSPPNRPGGAPPRLRSDAPANSMTTLALRAP
jgi:hypothetical protein